ncbi:TadE/TadG family type IV pilus assembly protein [Janibacter sp. GXQ6167]|uniref:TadE/TadG family type IV pilus assembly protein n=1 Tax=Janibacter sp. GXQ6167 TaxID=3240791 RepID=UPI003525384A
MILRRFLTRAVLLWRKRTASAEGGSAVVEFVVLGVLLLLPLLYLVLALARVQAGSYAVSQAARESGRAYVTSTRAAAAPGRAEAAAELAFADQGFAEEGVLEVQCDGDPCMRRGGRIVSTATVTVPLPLIPAFARDVIPLEIPVSATSIADVPLYEVRRD